MPSTTEIVTIASMGQKGEGLAPTPDGPIFLADALPGENFRIIREGSHAEILGRENSSPDRIDPVCEVYAECGGCQLQHWHQDPYLAFKRDLVVQALTHAGISAEVGLAIPAYGRGRRRATLHAEAGKAGFRARRSHDLVAIDHCPILVPELQKAPQIAARAAEIVGPCDAQFTASDTGLDLSLRTKSKTRTDLAPLMQEFKLARVALNGEVLVQSRVPEIRMGEAMVRLPVGSFLQATSEAEDVLSGLVLDALGKQKKVLDLFCGVGPFALRIARQAQTFAIDSDRQAVAACDAALTGTPGLKYLGTDVRDLFRDPLIKQELEAYSAIVFDPPRAGAKEQAREIARSKVKTVIAVSCDPQSFARDAAILINGGYRLKKVTPVDQFRYAHHVELVAHFKR